MIADPISSASDRRAAARSQIEAETGIDEAMIERLVRGLLCARSRGRIDRPDLLCPHRRLGAASRADVRLLVVGRADERRLSRPADAEALAAAGRRLAFRSLAGSVRATANEVCPPKAAAHFIKLAERVAESLELGVAGAHGRAARQGRALQIPTAGRRRLTIGPLACSSGPLAAAQAIILTLPAMRHCRADRALPRNCHGLPTVLATRSVAASQIRRRERSDAEVAPEDFRPPLQFVGRTFMDDVAIVDDVDALSQRQGRRQVLLDQHNGPSVRRHRAAGARRDRGR